MQALATPARDSLVAPFAGDEGLPGLARLFDVDWAWQAFCDRCGPPEEPPDSVALREFLYWPGSQAVATYRAERRWERWVVEDEFSIELRAGQPERLFRFPDDPYLPGLPQIASAPEAQDLIPRYVPLHPQRLHVETVRYRPTTRAVLRHIVGWRRQGVRDLILYARAMPPRRVGRLLRAGELAQRSGFVLPRLAGSWPEGGIVWLANTPGETVRQLIRQGAPPEPERILDALAPLWAAPLATDAGQPLDLAGGFRWTHDLLMRVLPDGAHHRLLRRTADALRPFAEAWQPTALAHNDCYDDQVILTPTGRLALVDFEEAGPGDPLFDVGNCLGHLRWMARFGIAPEACAAYRERLRDAALERFGWGERELALREAFSLFRLTSNAVRQIRPDWLQTAETGLSLALETLEQ